MIVPEDRLGDRVEDLSFIPYKDGYPSLTKLLGPGKPYLVPSNVRWTLNDDESKGQLTSEDWKYLFDSQFKMNAEGLFDLVQKKWTDDQIEIYRLNNGGLSPLVDFLYKARESAQFKDYPFWSDAEQWAMKNGAVTMPDPNYMQANIINVGKKMFELITLNFSEGRGIGERNEQYIERIGKEITEGILKVQSIYSDKTDQLDPFYFKRLFRNILQRDEREKRIHWFLFVACPYHNLPSMTQDDTPYTIFEKWDNMHHVNSPKKGILVNFEQHFVLQSGGWKSQVIEFFIKLKKCDQINELLNRLERKVYHSAVSMAFPENTLYNLPRKFDELVKQAPITVIEKQMNELDDFRSSIDSYILSLKFKMSLEIESKLGLGWGTALKSAPFYENAFSINGCMQSNNNISKVVREYKEWAQRNGRTTFEDTYEEAEAQFFFILELYIKKFEEILKLKCKRIEVFMKQIDEYVPNALNTERDKWITILGNMKETLQRLYKQIGNHSQYDIEVLNIIGLTQDHNDTSGLENIVSDFRRKHHIWEYGSMSNWEWLSNFLDQIVPFVEEIVNPIHPFTNVESQVFNNKQNVISHIHQIMDKFDASDDIQTLQQQQAFDQQTITDLKKQLDVQTQNARSLQNARDEITRLEAENRKLYNQWVEEQKEKERYQQEKKRLEDEKEDLEQEHKDLFRKMQTLKNELDSANSKYNESEQLLQYKVLELERMQKAFDRAEKEFEDYQSQKTDDIKDKEQEITTSRQKIQKIQREKNQIETELNELRNQISKKEREIANTKRLHDQQYQQVSQYTSTIESLQEQAAQSQRKIKQLEQSLQANEENEKEKASKIQYLTQELKTTKTKMASILQERNNFEENVESLTTELQKSKIKIQQMVSEINNLKGLQESGQDYKQTIYSLKESNRNKDRQVQDLQEQLEELRRQYNKVSLNQQNRTKIQYNDNSYQPNEMQDLVDELDSQIKSLQYQLKKAKSKTIEVIYDDQTYSSQDEIQELLENLQVQMKKLKRNKGPKIEIEYDDQTYSSQEDIQDLINSLVKKASQRIKVKDPQNHAILTSSEQVEQTMKRLWDLYKTFCEKVQRLTPEF